MHRITRGSVVGRRVVTIEHFSAPARHPAGVELQRVTVDDLMKVEGVDHDIATTVKDTLDRVAENTILDQYS